MKKALKNLLIELAAIFTAIAVYFLLDVFILGFIYQKLYTWLVVPLPFHLPPLTQAQAYGFALVWTTVMNSHPSIGEQELLQKQMEEHGIKEGKLGKALTKYFIHFILLGLGYGLSFFI